MDHAVRALTTVGNPQCHRAGLSEQNLQPWMLEAVSWSDLTEGRTNLLPSDLGCEGAAAFREGMEGSPTFASGWALLLFPMIVRSREWGRSRRCPPEGEGVRRTRGVSIEGYPAPLPGITAEVPLIGDRGMWQAGRAESCGNGARLVV